MMKQIQAWIRILRALPVPLALFAVPGAVHADGGGFIPKDVPVAQVSASPAIAPVQYTLSVELLEIEAEAGAQNGPTVTSSPAGLVCQDTCEQSFDEGTVVTLTLTGGDATDWTGCDSSSGNQCTVTMTSDKSVVVAITAPPPVQGASAERVGSWRVLGGALGLMILIGIGAYRWKRA